mgnify:CR=1 FL=1
MVKCNRGCGATDLEWKVVHGKYKLFNNNSLLHICNDGVQAPKLAQEKATAVILNELGLSEPLQIPLADEVHSHKEPKQKDLNLNVSEANGDASKMFTINSTASGIAVTGDDKHNAVYIPKVAVSELAKALIDFI